LSEARRPALHDECAPALCDDAGMFLLLLEDDVDLGQAVAEHLEAAGHQVHWCKLIEQARDVNAPDLALLDLGLPDGDGLDLLREWRRLGRRWPVIVLTARDQVSDRIRGLQAGADDYLVKPFDLDEMLARVDAVCRRSVPATHVTLGPLSIDLESKRVRREGEPVALTAMEWSVLEVLARCPGRVVSRARIDDELAVAGLADAESNSLEVIISRLRRKIGAEAISTQRGMGYRLDGAG
jgi:two-component system OmpR family response regulator